MNQAVDPEARDLGETLFALYEAARRMRLHNFQVRAIEILRTRIDFDCCWWGGGTRINGRNRVHHSYLWNMPEDTPDILNAAEQDNVVAQVAERHIGQALIFTSADMAGTAATMLIAQHAGLSEVMTVRLVDPVAELVSFISVGKQEETSARFHALDKKWLELLTPHLRAMVDMSRLNDLLTRRTAIEAPDALLAVTDGKGILHVAEPGFAELLRDEWSGWTGPWLPQPLISHLNCGRDRFRGRRLSAEFSRLDTQLLIKLTARTLLEELTAQETAVARLFGAGHSYKDVARALGVAPATVRHHLRAVYAKLRVQDKAALAQTLNRPPAMRPRAGSARRVENDRS